MHQQIKHKIENHVATQKITIAELERQAGLKMNAVRNIINGRSKKPSGETLRAIAQILECSVDDLLSSREVENSKEPQTSTAIQNPELFMDSMEAIFAVLEQRQHKPTIEELFFLAKEVYCYSLAKNPPELDRSFVEWVINKNL